MIYYEFESSRMICTSDWKYTERFPDGPSELYDLNNDREEQNNLADTAEYADIQKRLHNQLSEFFNHYADPKYDLWQDGGSKTKLLTFDKEPLGANC